MESILDFRDSIVACFMPPGQGTEAGTFREVRTTHRSFEQGEPRSPFMRNKIRTAKYTLLGFLPANLFEQFHRVANLYFLVISILQQLPGVSPTGKYTTIAPLFLVMTATAIKEAFEDYKRHKSDHVVNNHDAMVLHGKEFVRHPWKNVYPGDIVKVKAEQYFCADMVLISTSDPTGVAYIQTANLDGEVNLKLRQALTETNNIRNEEQLSETNFCIQCEHPNNNLHKFEGTLIVKEGQSLSLNLKQFLPRGTLLRNTEWVYAMIVFTGPETKLMLNTTASPIKRTRVENITNKQILNVLYLELFICFIGMIGAIGMNHTLGDEHWYLQLKNNSASFAIKSFFTFLILFNGMIPISLYVTIEMVKVVQGQFINNDMEMYYDKKDTAANARTTNLNEELGQVEYVFSDKTGTLTRNQMDFLRCSVGNVSYGEPEDSSAYSIDNTESTFNSDLFLRDLRKKDAHALMIDEYLTLLAVCHTVIPEKKGDSIEYQAASPDEGALVSAVAKLGYTFLERSPETITISVMGEKKVFQLYQIIEFDSVRKRMSVICRTPEGKLKLYCKGADSIIYARLKKDQGYEDQTLKFLEKFASTGLRTLCTSVINLDEEVYKAWNVRYQEASTSLEGRDDKINDLAEEIETNMRLIGTTAIEDKLQEGVPDTIRKLLVAGIKVWVLTGDKQETAINIGYSCGLLTDKMNLVIINQKSIEETIKFIDDQMSDLKDKTTSTVIENLALIIDGETLRFALDDKLKNKFLSFAKLCQSVVCCRVTPRQKAMVVELVKDNVKPEPITLAIGDGANDVPMIQSAHIGIGISGEEGMQAVFASDYSIAQFRFLLRLLLIHGRWSYIRTSRVILYSFYKNMTLQLTQFWFSMLSAFSGQTMIESWSLSLYNVMFTSLPIIVLGSFDRDISQKRIMDNPQLYMLGQEDYYFNRKNFWSWCVNGIFHSLILFFMVNAAYETSFPCPTGKSSDIWIMGTTLYTCVLVTVNMKITLEVASWTIFHHITIWGSVLLWFIFLAVYSQIYPTIPAGPEMSGMAGILFSLPLFYLVIFVVVSICLIRDIIWKYSNRTYSPQWYHIVQEIDNVTPADGTELVSTPLHGKLQVDIESKDKKGRIERQPTSHFGFAFNEDEGASRTAPRSGTQPPSR